MREYAVENGEVDLDILKAEFMSEEVYSEAHKGLVIPCHDVFILVDGGILLVNRDNVPAKDILWPIGGRINRGMISEDSLKLKVKQECGLDLEEIKYLDTCRTFFSTEPFGHGKGTDTLNLVYFAKGVGEVKLDDLHSKPVIVKKEDYEGMRDDLHPYVRDYLDVVISMI